MIATTTAEQRSYMVRRISNLVTTRSDSYTCYVLVQGWRNVGSASPELVTQRRAAFIADRSLIYGNDRSLSVVRVPTE